MKPDQSKIDKLPAWAREYIKDIERQRDVAVRELNQWCDSQTPSEIEIDELVCTGEGSGPSFKKRFIQSSRICFKHAGIELEVSIHDKDRINLQWSCFECGRDTAMIPRGYQNVWLVSKENMR